MPKPPEMVHKTVYALHDFPHTLFPIGHDLKESAVISMTRSGTKRAQPEPNGLYHPAFEHDACGVGMICDLNNHPSHALVQDALQILVNLTHRGACGCDETTGDGAGILVQKPHRFLVNAARGANIQLPATTDYCRRTGVPAQ